MAGYHAFYIVRFLQFILSPICIPLAWFLDKTLGDHHSFVRFSHSEMEILMKLITSDIDFKDTKINFHNDELQFLQGALWLRQCDLRKEMIPWKKVITLSSHITLSVKNLKEIWSTGFSRIYIYFIYIYVRI